MTTKITYRNKSFLVSLILIHKDSFHLLPPFSFLCHNKVEGKVGGFTTVRNIEILYNYLFIHTYKRRFLHRPKKVGDNYVLVIITMTGTFVRFTIKKLCNSFQSPVVLYTKIEFIIFKKFIRLRILNRCKPCTKIPNEHKHL